MATILMMVVPVNLPLNAGPHFVMTARRPRAHLAARKLNIKRLSIRRLCMRRLCIS
jgi:hypothetical protein